MKGIESRLGNRKDKFVVDVVVVDKLVGRYCKSVELQHNDCKIVGLDDSDWRWTP